MAAVDRVRPRRRGEADHVDQIERRAAGVEGAEEVGERVAAMVAGQGGERVAHSCDCAWSGQVLREHERAEVPNRGSHAHSSRSRSWKAISGAPDRIEVAAGVVVQEVALAFGEGSAGWRAVRRAAPGWS